MDKLSKSNIISLIVLIGFLVSILFHFILSGRPFNLDYPYDTFLLNKELQYGDYLRVYLQIRELNPYSDGLHPHFPIMNVFMFPFTYIGKYNGLVMLLFLFSVYQIFYVSAIIRENFLFVIIISYMTYPFIMTFERSNSAIFVYFILTLFLYFYQKKKHNLSSVFLGLAIGMKLFPAVFLILFIDKKMYRHAFYSISLSVLLNVLALFVFEGGLSLNLFTFFDNLSNYQYHYVELYRGIGYGHSLWGAFKVFYYGMTQLIFNELGAGGVKYFMFPYLVFSLMVFAFISYFIVYKEKKFWRKVALLVFCMNLLPFVSGVYKLMYLYVPLLLFINSKPSKNDMVFCAIFSFLMIPKHYLPLPWVPPYSITGYQGDLVNWSEVLIDPFLMVLASTIIIIDGFKNYKQN